MGYCLGMKTEIFQLDASNPDPEVIAEAGRFVDGGGLVGFPTETVYGIACRVERESLKRLDEAKGRPVDKRYSLHIGSADILGEYIPQLSLQANKLVSSLWPGPLTVVFELNGDDLEEQRSQMSAEVFDILYQDSTVGVRCPDNRIAAELLKSAKWPVVASSANLSGQSAAVTASGVIQQLDGRIDMLLAAKEDQSACDFQQNSTVVKVGGGKVTVLREGVVKKTRILDICRLNILFVCTGNTCRSPLGEYLCKKYISEKLDCKLDELFENGYNISSAGVFAFNGAPPSKEVVEVCSEKGIKASGHRSSALTFEMIRENDVIFAMTENHRQRILEMCPQAESKCLLLDGENDIADSD